MIPETIGAQTISFMDTIVARDSQPETKSSSAMDYQTISNERQNNPPPSQAVGKGIKPEAKTDTDPVVVHKVTSEIINKVKKLINDDQIDKLDEFELDDDLGELYFLLLNIIETRISDHVDKTTHNIAYINLQAEGAVETILAHANLLEATKDLGSKVAELAQKLLPGHQISTNDDLQLTPKLIDEVYIQVDQLVENYQQEFTNNIDLDTDVTLTDIKNETYQDLGLLPDFKEIESVQIYSQELRSEEPRAFSSLELELQTRIKAQTQKPIEVNPELVTNPEAMEAKDIEIKPEQLEIIKTKDVGIDYKQSEINPELTSNEINPIQIKIDKSKDKIVIELPEIDKQQLTIENIGQKSKNQEIKTGGVDLEPEIIENQLENQLEDLMGDSSLGDSSGQEAAQLSTGQNIQNNPINRLASKFDTIAVTDISNYLKDQVTELPKNTRQEIRLQLNPETLGKIDLTISKNENNEISIKMIFQDTKTMAHVKTELKDSLIELKEALKLKNLDLSKFEVGHSKSSSTAYDGQQKFNSFNEARDQQKERLLNRVPEWLKAAESANQASFAELVKGI